MSPRLSLILVLFCTTVFNLYLVWRLDSMQTREPVETEPRSGWVEEGLVILYDTGMPDVGVRYNISGLRTRNADTSPTVFQPGHFNSTPDISRRCRSGSRLFCTVEEYIAFVRRVDNDPDDVPQWARVLTIPTEGYHSFNTTASDGVGNHRPVLPETREAECLALNYDQLLFGANNLSTSVIIIFHNEARSTLLRAVHSVLTRTPETLLAEVILVDDASTFPWLRDALTDLLQNVPKTTLIRLGRRRGLIQARMAGAEAARSDVLVFLDAHVEVNNGWLEPLLHRINQNRHVVAVPQMDVIDWSTFEYWRAAQFNYGTFMWDLTFQFRIYPRRLSANRKNVTDPVPTPVMVGCAHAVDRRYFFASGGYDTGMRIWGGENIEHSFRIWICGGRVEILPCSRVGHVFKPKLPYSFEGDGKEVILGNLIRTAEVWMDEFSVYFYATQSLFTPVDLRSLAKRKHLRTKMKCQDFKWYLKNIIPELPIPRSEMNYMGQLKSVSDPSVCVHPDPQTKSLGVIKCIDQQLSDHFFYLDTGSRFMFRESCISVLRKPSGKRELKLAECPGNPNAHWLMSAEGTLRLVSGNETKCLSLEGNAVTMDACRQKVSGQLWTFSYKFDFEREWDLQDIARQRLKPPAGAAYFGWLRHIASHLCLSVHETPDHVMVSCDEQPDFEQILHLDRDGTLRYRDLCLGAPRLHTKTNVSVSISKCAEADVTSRIRWEYNAKTHQLKVKDTNYCLFFARRPSIMASGRAVLNICNPKAIEQKWRFRHKMQ